jgi:hypothetical protein
MRLYSNVAILFLTAAVLAGCTDSKSNKQDQDFKLTVEQTSFSLKQWKSDGSHRSSIGGTFMQGNQPVANAVLHAGNSKRNIETGDDGSFQILLDQSLLGETNVQVISLDHATINGKPIPQDQADKGIALSSALNVYYPIKIISTTVSAQDPDKTEIKGRLIADKTASVAFFQEDKFKIAGHVKAMDGKPVQGAIVWIDRDRGEGFAKSTPTEDNGYFSMYYLPEQDEDTNLTVDYKSVKYTLPANKVFHFPENTSLNIDITLPREGTVIEDKPPTLVNHTAPGALYVGMMVGLDVENDVSYKVTIPDAEGNFTMTVPTKVWEGNPTFFETNMSKFIEKDKLKPGDSVPSSFIEMEPDAARNIKSEPKPKA